jgi:acyl carrier protein
MSANEIIDVVAAEGMIDRSKVTPDATIESLDLKSVDIVMILTALEEKFNVYIPMDGTLQEAKDVKSLINAIVDLIIKEREKS